MLWLALEYVSEDKASCIDVDFVFIEVGRVAQRNALVEGEQFLMLWIAVFVWAEK